MTLSEKLEMVTELMKKTKERWVSHEPDNPDLAMYLHIFRGDEPVITVQCPLDRDTALKAALLAAPGFSASDITLTFESYTTTHRKSPITGEPWMPREMQFVAQTVPDAFEKGWVNECLTTSAHSRNGEYALASQGYRIKDGKVEWLELKNMNPEHENPGDPKAEGFMFDNLQAAMARPPIEEQIAESAVSNPMTAMMAELFADDPERRQFHIDMATAKVLEDNELAIAVMVMADQGSDRAEWLAERLGEPGNDITEM